MVIGKISTEISIISRHNLFNNDNPDTLINQLLQTEKTSGIPFVTTWHQRLSAFQSKITFTNDPSDDEELNYVSFSYDKVIVQMDLNGYSIDNWNLSCDTLLKVIWKVFVYEKSCNVC